MKSTFAKLLRMLSALVVVALVLAACGSTGGTPTPGATSSTGGTLAPGASFKLGVSLTFNNTDFWTNYIKYETQFATQYNATLIGPLVANNDAAKQITAEDRARLSGYVTTIMEKAEFDPERITAEVRRAMSGREVVA